MHQMGSRYPPNTPPDTVQVPTVGAVNRSCEKLGCNEPAEVAFGIDRAACVVWLENYDADEARHLNRLCDDHAARLTLPRGWTFDDRREKSPRLFVAPRPAAQRAKPVTKLSRPASTKPASKAGNKAARTSSGNTTSVPRRTSRDASAPVKRFDGPGLFDPTLPMGSPKLIRCSRATPPTECPRHAMPPVRPRSRPSPQRWTRRRPTRRSTRRSSTERAMSVAP